MSILVENLCHTYSKGTPFSVEALEDVSFVIEQGSFFGIIGQTGSGKSTLVQHLNGLIPADRGRVEVDGVELSGSYDRRRLRSHVGMVFQYPEQQLFEETVEKDICFGPKNNGLSTDEQLQRCRQAMQMMGLDYEELAARSPFELSGGQKRRVAIAGVLAMQPGYLILDEPAAGLDPEGRRNLLEVIKQLHTEGITVVLVSHSMDDIAAYADTILVMDRGRAQQCGSPQQIFSEGEYLASIGLGLPKMVQMSLLLQARGVQVPVTMSAQQMAHTLASLRKEVD